MKAGKKPNLVDWGTEPIAKEGLLHTIIDGEMIRKTLPTLQGNYYDFFEGIYQAIVNDIVEPVTALEGIQVMKIIEAALQSSEEKKGIDL